MDPEFCQVFFADITKHHAIFVKHQSISLNYQGSKVVLFFIHTESFVVGAEVLRKTDQFMSKSRIAGSPSHGFLNTEGLK